MRKKHRDYKSGIYRPKNHDKFSGCIKCQYRSSWELAFLKWCDMNSNVEKVFYEKTIIPYMSPVDKKLHRYIVDFKILIKNQYYLIEVKPFRQTIPPKPHGNKKRTTLLYEQCTYAVNKEGKWKAAKQYCNKKNYKWAILTEKGVYIDDKFYENIKLKINS